MLIMQITNANFNPLYRLQSLVGNIDKAMKTIHNYHQVWKQFGFTPEFYNIGKAEAVSKREGYPLRPGKLTFLWVNYFLVYKQQIWPEGEMLS
jgi:hypothetical protein